MAYHSETHHRRSIRLKGYDYSQNGLYFITICCYHRMNRFGRIENNQMILNEFGEIAFSEWIKLTERFQNFELDVFQIMPNHMHGIIMLHNNVGAGFTPDLNEIGQPQIVQQQLGQPKIVQQQFGQPQNVQQQFGQPQNVQQQLGQPKIVQQQFGQPQNVQQQLGQPRGIAPTVSNMVGAYKSLVANGCLGICKMKNEMMGTLWQRNYYEHIIRNEQSYQNISKYIINNPTRWQNDQFNHTKAAANNRSKSKGH